MKNSIQKVSLFRHQQGVVLLMALIMLVALTLAGIALVRSVDTTNIIAGNLAFKQGATHAGDLGAEAAINYLSGRSATDLLTDDTVNGYYASRGDPGPTQNWETFLRGLSTADLPKDAATGNTVEYVAHRMCSTNRPSSDPTSGCAIPPSVDLTEGSSLGIGIGKLARSSQVYFRVTTKVTGPRNTVSLTQTILAF